MDSERIPRGLCRGEDQFQVKCIKKGINGVGIPDLIIAQNARQNDCAIYSLDRHFVLMEKVLNIEVLPRL